MQQIATDFGIIKEGVRNIYKKIETTGKSENSVRTGRKRKTTPRKDREIVKITKKRSIYYCQTAQIRFKFANRDHSNKIPFIRS